MCSLRLSVRRRMIMTTRIYILIEIKEKTSQQRDKATIPILTPFITNCGKGEIS